MTTDQKIVSKAPTRIDLSGGTLDIWPIYLFLNSPTTINLAIDLFAETTLEETSEEGKITLKSEDQGAQLQCTWRTIEETPAPPSLLLHHRLLKLFYQAKVKTGLHDPKKGLTLSTRAKSPAGAGLGGSSALSVSMIGALATWAEGVKKKQSGLDAPDPKVHGTSWIEIVRDVESTVIQVPAGLQDYYGAMFGGLQSLHWLPGSHARVSFDPSTLKALEERIILFYSGQSRNSGINNWALFKSFIDREGKVRDQFEAIAAATVALETALRKSNWKDCETAIAQEWEVRRGLARGISTPEMDYAFQIAKKDGVTSGKVCGAGGGGCFFLFVPSGDPELKAKLEKQITAQGIRALPFKASVSGLHIS